MRTVLTLAAGLLLAGAAAAEAFSYKLDPQHTFVTFEVKHNKTSTVRGRFDRTEGVVQIDRQARSGKLEVTVATDSLSTGVAPLDGRLKGADYLNVAQTAVATFKSDAMAFDGDKLASVSGQLTLLGKSLPVTLKAVAFNCYDSPFYKREICGGDFEADILRSQWGISSGLPGIPDAVHLVIQVEAIRQ